MGANRSTDVVEKATWILAPIIWFGAEKLAAIPPPLGF
jgi:hypothetical protein